MDDEKNITQMTEEEYIETAEMTGNQVVDSFTKERKKWTYVLSKMNEEMKDLPHLDELQNKIYMKRQEAVDYFYGLNAVILSQTKLYKHEFNNQFNNIKVNGYNGIRFSTDQMISRHIEVMLQERKETIDMLTNQQNFIKDTISTIDNIIYGINTKVKIKEMLNGLKF
ncbi:MAG: hypothetical protein [Wendovervirus sonii]|uniref:Uncharacterized protein n=1 Tax=phage Lak_Megaphage_Sonny TaxID=3109229 RepID=A0ABZ0Z4Y1_9CAUD|nr:MAG: hypothetical protein [phage Lak_Megaphage_Sonny]